MNTVSAEQLKTMDTQADAHIKGWSFTALIGNLAPPPFDTIAIGMVFAGMGANLSSIYGVNRSARELFTIGKSMAKGIGAVAVAGHIGTGMLKWIPGLNIWVALLVQPPLVAAVTYAVGNAFKQYYRVLVSEDIILTPDEMKKLAMEALQSKLGHGRVF